MDNDESSGVFAVGDGTRYPESGELEIQVRGSANLIFKVVGKPLHQIPPLRKFNSNIFYGDSPSEQLRLIII